MQNKQREVKEFDSHIIRRRFVGCLPLILIFLSSTAIMSGSNRGNIRVVVDDNGRLLQATDYLAFGLPVTTLPQPAVDNRLYEGNEFQNFRGLGWTDNTARRLDNILCRFTAPDPLAEKYPDLSPYASRANNPLMYIDPSGEKILIESSDCGWLTYRENELYDEQGNLYNGNDTFVYDTITDLEHIKDNDSLLKERTDILEKSTNIHKIVSTDGFDHNTVENGFDEQKHIPTGSTTFHNTNLKVTPSGEQRDKMADIAHELLSHGFDADQGITKFGETENGIKLYEVDAVKIENRIRTINGKAPRVTYGNGTILNELLK